MNSIKIGSIIKGLNWHEPVEIKDIKEVGQYINIVGSTIHSRTHIDDLISREEFSCLNIINTGATCSEAPWKIFLALETKRFRFASVYDPLLAMNTSKVDPLPHQIEAVYGYVLKLPRIRFLIADDPGSGKTIMAGLIIKELKLRHLIKRILIIAPGHLRDQWRRELKERFEEKFIIVDRGFLDAHYAENVWTKENQIITSIDFAKKEDVLPALCSASFDLIIVDEAHKMSAYRYGDKIDKTSRYQLGEAISQNAEHILFLTATPHKGDPENFRLFLDLLEPGFFATTDIIHESIRSKDNPLFIRRMKEDLKDFDGKPLFLPRYVKTIPFEWKTQSQDEMELYNELSKYVSEQYNKALLKDKKRNIAFAVVILQRRLASSTYALLKSLERRKKRLEELLTAKQVNQKTFTNFYDFNAYEDLREEERWKEEEVWETLSVAENAEEMEKEIQIIENLIQRATHIITEEQESKLKELKKSLQELSIHYPDPKDNKVLIFTESRDTLEYLEKKIRTWGYAVNTIHGGMKLEERIKAEGIFKTDTMVLVATEAAGEGINLQFCSMMINYDIPWNPNRLEQRMGRIHRYGQQKEVNIFNLVAMDTREGKVFRKLFEKLDQIKEAMGSDKIFDVLSEVMYQKNLSQLLIEAASCARKLEDILKEIDITVNDEYIATIKENLGESLATRYIDYTRIKEMAHQARERRLIPEYTESFFQKAFTKANGKLKHRKDGFMSVESIPFDFRKIADEDHFKKTYGELLKKYPKITFDKEIAFKNPDSEFVSFGHPLFEATMTWVENNFSESLLKGATFIDPDGKLDGYVLFYEGNIRDGSGTIAGKRMFSFYVTDNEINAIPPSFLWDLKESDTFEQNAIDIDTLKTRCSNAIVPELEKYKTELLKERYRQAEIKQKYGIKSLEHLIISLDNDLISLYDRKNNGEDVDLVIRNKEERKKVYESAIKNLKDHIEREKSLTMNMPRFVGIIRVKPENFHKKSIKTDEEIEQIGMKKALDYEISQFRTPEDVSSENLGFDIRSKDKQGNIRYIEVKTRAESGPVMMTQNEWFKAKRLKDNYFLYVILNAATIPQLYIVQNPAACLSPEEKFEAVRYKVSLEEIKDKGKKEDGGRRR